MYTDSLPPVSEKMYNLFVDTPYVSDGSAATAREMERRFQLLPPEAGILFIAVKPEPALEGLCNQFTVFLGLYRNRITDTNTGAAIAKKVLEPEIKTGMLHFRLIVYRGVAGAARDGDLEVSHPLA